MVGEVILNLKMVSQALLAAEFARFIGFLMIVHAAGKAPFFKGLWQRICDRQGKDIVPDALRIGLYLHVQAPPLPTYIISCDVCVGPARGGKPCDKLGELVYRDLSRGLIAAGVLRKDNTLVEAVADLD